MQHTCSTHGRYHPGDLFDEDCNCYDSSYTYGSNTWRPIGFGLQPRIASDQCSSNRVRKMEAGNKGESIKCVNDHEQSVLNNTSTIGGRLLCRLIGHSFPSVKYKAVSVLLI